MTIFASGEFSLPSWNENVSDQTLPQRLRKYRIAEELQLCPPRFEAYDYSRGCAERSAQY